MIDTKKPKVLFLINKLKLGGAENLVVGQVNNIGRYGYEPTLACLYSDSPSSIVDSLKIEIPHISLGFRFLFDLRGWWRLYLYLRKEHFTIIVTNLFESNFVGRLMAVLARVPHLVAYEHNLSPDRRFWQVVVGRLLLPFTATIIVGATQVKDFFIQQEKVPIDKILVNYNAVELLFADVGKKRSDVLARYGLATNKKYLVTAGRLVEQKGHIYLLEAMAILHKQNSLNDFQGLIFGDGVLHEQLTGRATELGLAEVVNFYPSAPMRDVLAVCDIFVFPSLWEGLSLALLSAMNAARPIVATKISGTEEAVVEGESALLVPAKDSRALAEALVKVIQDDSLRLHLGQGAKDRSELFSIDKNVEVLARHFDYLANSSVVIS